MLSKIQEIQPIQNPFKAKVQIPGCLSYTTRSLVLSAMTEGVVRLNNPLKSDDVYSMINCLTEVGIEIEEFEDYFLVKNCIQDLALAKSADLALKKFLNKEVNFVCSGGISGRTVRSILPLLCLVPGQKVLTADKEFLKRPIADQVDGLRQLGAEIEYLEEDGRLPVLIKSSKLTKNYCKMKGSVSSQYFAGIMMIAPLFGGVEVEVIGEQVSKSYIDITVDIMKSFGVEVENQDYKKYIVKKQKYSLLKKQGVIPPLGGQGGVPPNKKSEDISSYQVEGDYSSASYFACMTALTGSEIELLNLNPNSVQGDKMVLDILQKMGAKVEFKENSVIVKGGELKPVTVNMENAIDQPPVIAVLASFAPGVTEIQGIGILKYKETDRLTATVNELKKMGIKTEVSSGGQTLKIFGGKPVGAEIETYGDHRIAMAFSIAGLKTPNQKIKNPEVVKKSFPDFWEVMFGVVG